VHDVEGGAGEPGQHDRPVGGLLLGLPWPGQAVVDRRRLATGQGLLHEDVDDGAVLGVHHDERAVLAGPLHRAEDLAVVGQEDAGVGHEELEAGDALPDELVHRLEGVLVDPPEDLVEPVVDRAVPGCLGVPGRQAVLDPLARPLHREVDDRRRAPQAAALVPVSKVSLGAVPPKGSSMCVCTSTPPGTTYFPVASTTTSAAPARSTPSVVSLGATRATTRSPSTSTSARHRPLALSTVPPRISVVIRASPG